MPRFVIGYPAQLRLDEQSHGSTGNRVRLPAALHSTVPIGWRRIEGDSIAVRMHGGMWGIAYVFARRGDQLSGRAEAWSDMTDEAGSYSLAGRRIGCGEVEWDEGGPVVKGVIVGGSAQAHTAHSG